MPLAPPKALTYGLLVIALASLVFSVYLERTELAYLQAHPVLTNLLSGVVGFAFASFIVTVGFRWFTQRSHINALRPSVRDAWMRVITFYKMWVFEIVVSPMPPRNRHELDQAAEELIRFNFPLLVHLLALQNDFVVTSHLRLLEEKQNLFNQDDQVKILELIDTIHEFAMRLARSENGRRLGLDLTLRELIRK